VLQMPPMLRRSVGGLAFAVLTAWAARRAEAMCVDGTQTSCLKNGVRGFRECVGGRFTPCIVEPEDPPVEVGTVTPRYSVLAIIYAPPGATGGSGSSVSYGNGSSLGSATSTSGSFKQAYSVAASAGGGFLGKVEVGVSFGYQRSSTDTDSVEIVKSASTTINVRGPAADGINHDQDEIWLLLSPRLRVEVSQTSVTWAFDPAGLTELQNVFVGWLKGNPPMPQNVSDTLARHGITPTDFPNILQNNPLASGMSPASDPVRYRDLNLVVPYTPPLAAGNPPTSIGISLTGSETNAQGTTVTNDYTVGVTVSASGDFVSLFNASLKTSASWTWSNSNTIRSSSGSTETAAATISGPSFGYTGPTQMKVFFDTVYRTFAFHPFTGAAVSLRGRMLSPTGRPLAGEEVTVIAGRQRFRTYTDANGNYAVPWELQGPVTVEAVGIRRTLQAVEPNQSLELQLR
jgi:hypothetical protein